MNERILLVDDDRYVLSSLKKALEKNGYNVDTAETAGAAIDKLRVRSYDLALIDQVLPDMKGTDLLAKAKNELQQTVKFIITGYPTARTGASAREEKADAFILKPIAITELLSIIRAFFEEEQIDQDEEKKFTLSEVT